LKHIQKVEISLLEMMLTLDIVEEQLAMVVMVLLLPNRIIQIKMEKLITIIKRKERILLSDHIQEVKLKSM